MDEIEKVAFEYNGRQIEYNVTPELREQYTIMLAHTETRRHIFEVHGLKPDRKNWKLETPLSASDQTLVDEADELQQAFFKHFKQLNAALTAPELNRALQHFAAPYKPKSPPSRQQ